MRPISSHLDRTELVNKGFIIIWLLGKFFLWDTTGSPEQARWFHLARWGRQSHCVIWLILPTRRAGHIIRNINLVFSLLWNSAVLFYIQYMYKSGTMYWVCTTKPQGFWCSYPQAYQSNLFATLLVSPCMVVKSSLKWS